MADLSLDNIVTNDMNFKHLETTKDITISIKNENGFPQRPDATHTWTAKVSDGTNYVGDYAVKIDQTSLIVDSENFTKLPTGSYQLEVWEEWIDSDGTKQRSIYPSPSQTIPFTIYANLTDQAEKEIKSIGFQDVVDQAVMNIGMNYVFKVNTIEPDQTATVVQSASDGKNYVTFNIPQGPKGDQGNVGPAPTLKIGTVTKLNSDQTPTANVSGDNGAYTLDLGIPQGSKGNTGTVDNTGLINAPAFQSLQTQVNNSAVGINLLTGTGYHTVTGTDGYGLPCNETIGDLLTLFKELEGQTLTVSVDYEYSGFVAGSDNNRLGWEIGIYGDSTAWAGLWYYPTNDSGSGRKSYTFVVPKNITSIEEGYAYIQFSGAGTGALSHFKLEKGSVATPWCPNPSEILTQGDYAKIKAAIVALGGSLS